MSFYVYILASERNGTLYIGHTDSLTRRMWEHQEAVRPGFASKYGVKRLVYFEVFEGREGAFAREGDEKMAAVMEDRTDRAVQSKLAESG